MVKDKSREPSEVTEEVTDPQKNTAEQQERIQAETDSVGGLVDNEMDASDEHNALQLDLAAAQEQLKATQEQILRAQADSQNVRRRAERDVENAHKFALEKFVGELLPVIDNLERALAAANADEGANSSISEGVELTLKSFLDVLTKFKVEQIDPHGEPFDPQNHQAMTVIENPDAEPNTVLDVMQKGYGLNGRLLRPAMVVVSKPQSQKNIDEEA